MVNMSGDKMIDYPGHVVAPGDSDIAAITAICDRLRERGYAVPAGAKSYDSDVAAFVRQFQSMHSDGAGRPLGVDGKVGPLTWSALFGAEPVATPPTGLAGAALATAVSQIGVMEDPPGSNKGRKVEEYLGAVGVPPGSYWCMAFVNWCFQHAASQLKTNNNFPRTGGCLDAWNRVKSKSPACIVTREQAVADPSRIRPGFVFILDHGKGLGHTGFVKQAIGGALRTIEGNSNPVGSSYGIGVFELNRRNVMNSDLKGFLDFTHDSA